MRAAERAIVPRRFGGSRAPYLGALRRAGASPAVALGGIADELRRETLLVQAPRDDAVCGRDRRVRVDVRLGAAPRHPRRRRAVPGVDPTTPLGLLPDELARPAIVRALRHAARVRALRDLGRAQQERALDEIRCIRDRLPTVGAVPLTSWMPFLAPLAATGVGVSTATTVPLPAPLAR